MLIVFVRVLLVVSCCGKWGPASTHFLASICRNLEPFWGQTQTLILVKRLIHA